MKGNKMRNVRKRCRINDWKLVNRISGIFIIIFVSATLSTGQIVDKKQFQSYPLIFNLVWGGGCDWWQNQFDWNLTVYCDSIPVKRAQSAYGMKDSIYWSFTTDWNAGEPLNRLMTIPDEWYVRTASGAKISYSGTYLVDPTNYCPQVNGKRFNEKLADTLAVNANPTIWDGVNSDGTWAFPFLNLNDVDLDRNGVADYSETTHGSTAAARQSWICQTWAAGYYTMANRLRTKTGWTNKLLTYWTVKDTMGMHVFNGAGWENAPQNAPVTFDVSFPDAGLNGFNSGKQIFDAWNSVTSAPTPRMNYLSASMASEGSNANCPQPFWQHGQEWYRYMRWTLGMALITDAYYNIQDADASSGVLDHSASFYYDEFKSLLGKPITNGLYHIASNSVWVRFFDNGVVIQYAPASTAASSVTVTDAMISGLVGYSGPYYRMYSNQDTAWNNGSRFSSVNLTAVTPVRWHQGIGDAIILKKTQDTVICPIIVDNAYAGTTPGSSEAVLTNFSWDQGANGGTALDYNPTYNVGYRGSTNARWYRSHMAAAGNGSATAVYTPGINRTGYWRVYEWHGWAGETQSSYVEASNVPCRINYADGYKDTVINQRLNYGKWNLLGTFPYTPSGNKSLTITNNADGVVIADAFKWEWVPSSVPYVPTVPTTPTPSAPSDDTTGVSVTPTLMWSSSTGTDQYHLQVSTDSLFTSVVLNDSTLTAASRQTPTLEYKKTYNWRIAAKNSAGSSAYSTVYQFTTKNPVPSVPVLATPSNGATAVDLTPTLTWNAATGAERYRVQLATDSLFTSIVLNDSTITTTSRQVSTLEYQKLYYWRVAAINSTGSSTYSIPFRFTTKNGVPSAPILATPSNGATGVNLDPVLTWNAVAGATQYRLQVAIDSSFSTIIINDSTITTTSNQMSGLDYQQKYYWKVSAKNNNGTGQWSVTRNFTTIVAAPDVPTLSSPSDGTIDVVLNPVLNWNPVPNAVTYHVQVAVDSLFSSIVVNDSSLSSASRQLTSLLGSTIYYWHVKAKNGTGTSSFSVVLRFATQTQLVVNRSTIDFGNVAIGRSKTDSIMVKNNGSQSVSILSINQTSPQFSVSPQSGTIAPRDSMKVKVVFTPTDKASYSGITSLSITKVTDIETVVTKGSGIRPPKIRRTPSTVTMAMASTGVSRDSFRVYNEGDEELTISTAITTNPKITIFPTSGSVASNDSMTFYVSVENKKSTPDSGFVILVNNSDLMLDSAKIKITLVSGVDDPDGNPAQFTLYENYPNPFNPTTTISYNLIAEAKVVLKIYNVLGEEIRTLADEIQPQGMKTIAWNATDNNNNQVSSGMYFYRLEAVPIQAGESFAQVKKMLLLK